MSSAGPQQAGTPLSCARPAPRAPPGRLHWGPQRLRRGAAAAGGRSRERSSTRRAPFRGPPGCLRDRLCGASRRRRGRRGRTRHGQAARRAGMSAGLRWMG
ncbi:hypothetical protein HK405_004210, partial [Cladochytrium tenue]